MVFKNFNLKYDGMRKAQDFVLYPFTGGHTVKLQSKTRICIVNVHTGEGISSIAHSNGSYGHDLAESRGAYKIKLEDTKVEEIKAYLRLAGGVRSNGFLSIENKPFLEVEPNL